MISITSRVRSSLRAAMVTAPLTLAVGAVACSSQPTGKELDDDSAEALAVSGGTTATLVSSGLCLQATKYNAGATLTQQPCASAQHDQRYLFEANGAGEYTIESSGNTSLCLDFGDAPGTGANVTLQSCSASKPSQLWTVTPVSSGVYTVAAAGVKGCLGVAGASTRSGADIITWTCVGGAASEQIKLTLSGVTGPDAGPPVTTDAGKPTTDAGPPSTGACAGASTSVEGPKDASHPSGEAPPTCTPSGFKIAYIDDFPGKSLSSGWTLPSGFQYSGSRSWVSSSLVTVHDGMMDIEEQYSGKAGEEAVVGWAQLTNDPAALLKYGKLLVRQRADVQTNVAVATLTWPVPANTWPPEIDFAEDDVGDRHWYAFNHYKNAAGKNTQTWEDSGLTSSDWHTWGIEWTPSSIVYTRDGAAWKTETDPEVIPSIQMYLGFVMACFDTPPVGSSHWQMDWVALYSKE